MSFKYEISYRLAVLFFPILSLVIASLNAVNNQCLEMIVFNLSPHTPAPHFLWVTQFIAAWPLIAGF